jgi:hypothetical protein
MMAMTTSSSIKVKPRAARRLSSDCLMKITPRKTACKLRRERTWGEEA